MAESVFDHLDKLQEALLADELVKVIVALMTAKGESVEQFVFEISVSLHFQLFQLSMPTLSTFAHEVVTLQMTRSQMTVADLSELEPLLKSALLRLQNCAAVLDPIPAGGCTNACTGMWQQLTGQADASHGVSVQFFPASHIHWVSCVEED